MYHTLIYQRRGMKVNALVDDDAPVVAEIMGTERKMDYSEMHVGGKAFKIQSLMKAIIFELFYYINGYFMV